ncbi:hypothetical protein X740_24765 [Mesorhizobium sp. LNHC221B00]|nr:hypothetical protein X740_24765 [Mesorhizobium sp. LNHC221B00]
MAAFRLRREVDRDIALLRRAAQKGVPDKTVEVEWRRDGMFKWGSKRAFEPLPEPKELVDALLNELRFAPAQHAAIERQAALWRNL